MTDDCKHCLDKDSQIIELKNKLSAAQRRINGLEKLMMKKEYVEWLGRRKHKRGAEANKKRSEAMKERHRILTQNRDALNARRRERAALKRAELKKAQNNPE
jgi:hypothetical protein